MTLAPETIVAEPRPARRILLVGHGLERIGQVIGRRAGLLESEQVATLSEAVDVASLALSLGERFDCILIDVRDPVSGSALNVVAIAALRAADTVAVLCPEGQGGDFRSLVGVHKVLEAPLEARSIFEVIAGAQTANAEPETEAEPQTPTDPDPEPVEEGACQTIAHGEPEIDEADRQHVEIKGNLEKFEKPKAAVAKGFESSVKKIEEADQQVWQRFVPLANFVYKKLAITILTSLFLAFVAYGSMIVFFMGSSSWALPFELSRGHVLVEKAERDLSSMRLRRNQIRQDLSSAKVERIGADRAERDGRLQLTLTQRTVEEEINLQTTAKLEIQQHIARLKQVIEDFNRVNGRGGFAKNLKGAYDKRLITRKALNSGTLAVLETLHRVATVQNEISIKQLELQRVARRLEFLRTLLEEIKQPEVRVITSAGSDLAHLAREVIEAKSLIAASAKAAEDAKRRQERMQNSLDVISAAIASLEKTPAARALQAPVRVLFVPYPNADAYTAGKPLEACLLYMFVCSTVGEVGAPVDGETTAVHPLFGKPLRGTFVEAEFRDARSATTEIVHANGAPLFF